jgi:hypothetical protein
MSFKLVLLYWLLITVVKVKLSLYRPGQTLGFPGG